MSVDKWLQHTLLSEDVMHVYNMDEDELSLLKVKVSKCMKALSIELDKIYGSNDYMMKFEFIQRRMRLGYIGVDELKKHLLKLDHIHQNYLEGPEVCKWHLDNLEECHRCYMMKAEYQFNNFELRDGDKGIIPFK